MLISIFIIIFIGTTFVLLFVILNVYGKKKLEKALELMRNGKHEEALVILKDLYSKNPGTKLYNWYIAQCYENLGDLEMAIVEYQKVALSTELPPPLSLLKIHEKLGLLNMKLGSFLKAKNEFNTVISINPTDAMAHYYLGDIYYRENDYQKAIDHLEKAIQYNDSIVDAYLKLGKLNYYLNHNEKAKKYLLQALRRDRSLAEAHFYYALLLEKDRVYDRSIEEFNEALKGELFNFDCYYHLGNIYKDIGDVSKATENYERAIEVGTDDMEKYLEVKYVYADFLVHQGNLERALILWKEIHNVRPSYRDVDHKLKIYEEISKSHNLTRFVTSTRDEFLDIGRKILEVLNIIAEKYSMLKDDLLEFVGKNRIGKEEISVVVHIAKWTILVGEIPIRELLEKMSDEGASRAIFITSSDFTEKAYDLSRIRPLELISRKDLEKILDKVFQV